MIVWITEPWYATLISPLRLPALNAEDYANQAVKRTLMLNLTLSAQCTPTHIGKPPPWERGKMKKSKTTKHQKTLQKQRAIQLSKALTQTQFTCANCETEVKFRRCLDAKVTVDKTIVGTHDACPRCEWSRHVAYGTDNFPPCGGMMKPVKFYMQQAMNEITDEEMVLRFVRRRCECGWETKSPTQTEQAETPDADSVHLCMWGADGDGKEMGSPWNDLNYFRSPDEWHESERKTQ
jgi:hypothetical protein